MDASPIIEWLLQTPLAPKVEQRLFSRSPDAHAPHLLDVEVAQVLRRYVASGQVKAERAQQALQHFLDLPIQRYPHDFLLGRVWELRDTFTAYDAIYIALAEALDAPLVTCDRRLGKASGHSAVLEVI